MTAERKPWDGLFSEQDRAVRTAGGYGSRGPIGARPAVLVIDVTRNFTGDKGDDHIASIKMFRSSCGPLAWRAIPHIQRLIVAGRARGIPVIFTRAQRLPAELKLAQRRKNKRAGGETEESRSRGYEFPDEIAPRPGEIVIEKAKPSPFFGTPLLSHLQTRDVDHLLVAGCTTSGGV